FLAYNNEDDRCTTSSGVRPRVLHEYDLAAFRPVVASGAATGVMAAYNLVNGRPCHVSPLIGSELRRWAEPTGHELFVVSDAEAPSNLVDPEHYFDDHAEAHAAALKAGIDSFTDHGTDSATPVGRLREALDRGLIDEDDVDRAVRRQLLLRFRLGEFDPDLDPYAGIGVDVVDSPGHRVLATRAATESVVLLKNDGLLPLHEARAPRVAVIGPLADVLHEDWYSGTMPHQVTVAAGLAGRLADVTVVEGLDRISLRSRTTGRALGDTAFDVAEWGGGVVTLRDAGTGLYLSAKDSALVADVERIKTWDVRETFRFVSVTADGDTVLLRSVLTGRYAAIDP
ncbi:glycoside hydrolase family 3 C-terminal domain-containing protein, partial [Actinosynnema sp. NPDC023658]|uniref:glycoside hydrolase family 3 C-terminal domain-containing protein n=1 Tax=Actinosynnema sp. NPDC023658 TaxID=3155465 RepID=UPI0033D720B0